MSPFVEHAKAQTRTEATEIAYLAAGIRHAVRAGALRGLVLDFELFVQSLEAETGILRPRTVRLYTAEVTTTIEVWGRQAGISPEKIDELNARARIAFAARAGTPTERRTASRKVKTADVTEIRKVLHDLDARASDAGADLVDQLMPDFIEALSKTGARPIELLGARLDGDNLTFLNAKATNGRAGGPTRPFSLVPFSADFRARIERLLPKLNDLVAQSRLIARDDKGVLNLLAARLARSCTRVKNRRLALYSFRHAALAAWTNMGLSPAHIAALAGQVSIHTGPRHYSRSRNGLEVGDKPVACPELVQLIEARHRNAESDQSGEAALPEVRVEGDEPDGVVDAPLHSPAPPDELMPPGKEKLSPISDPTLWFEAFPTPAAKEPDNKAKALSDELGRAAKARAERMNRDVAATALGIRLRNKRLLDDDPSNVEGQDGGPARGSEATHRQI